MKVYWYFYVALLATAPLELLAQSNASALKVATLAGTPDTIFISQDGRGKRALFADPTGLAVDAKGNVYVTDETWHTIRKITPDGEVTTIAGNPRLGHDMTGSADGPGLTARFADPSGIAIDQSGNLYVADQNNSTIRKITPAGVVSTVAGKAGAEGSLDGAGEQARFLNPFAVAVDAAGTLYVADTGNGTIRKVSPGGVVTTLAGQPGSYDSIDGQGSAAHFDSPFGVAVNAEGTVYVADQVGTIRQITPDGRVTTLAGVAGQKGSQDGMGSAARFDAPTGVAVDANGIIYVADQENALIRRITPAGVVTTLAGVAGMPGATNGPVGKALFAQPTGVAVDGTGTIYVADPGNDTIRSIR